LLKSTPSRLLNEPLAPLTEKLVNKLAPSNAPLPIEVTPLPIVTLVNELAPENARTAMVVILLSIVTAPAQKLFPVTACSALTV
jgi:hypothetical protein